MFAKSLALAAAFIAIFAQPAAASDDLARLRYLVGHWHCAYHTGAQTQTFDASFVFAQGGNWLQETDTWKGGGDQGFITLDAGRRRWTEVVLDGGRAPTILRGPDAGATKLDLRSVFPDSRLHTVIAKVDSTHFSVVATQAGASGEVSSNDLCTRQR